MSLEDIKAELAPVVAEYAAQTARLATEIMACHNEMIERFNNLAITLDQNERTLLRDWMDEQTRDMGAALDNLTNAALEAIE